MAIVMIEGFDLYNGTGTGTGLGAKWSSATSASLVTGRSGGQAMRIGQGAGGANCTRTLPSTYNAFAHGLAFRAVTLPLNNNVSPACAYVSAGTFQWGWQVNSSGAIVVYRYSSFFAGTLLGTSANGVIVANTFHYIQIESQISATVGTVTIKVDGVAVLTLTGLNNKNAGTSTIDSICFGGGGAYGGGSGYNQDMDDMYFVDTNAAIGERRVETLRPSADVAQGFARSAGTANFSLVNETLADGDTTYVQGSNVGDVDTYDFGDLSSTPFAISAVQMSIFGEKTDVTTRSIAAQVKSGATTSDGSNLALATTYAKLERIMETDPNTSAAWTATAVNALRAGPKVTV
jgi:hypothetical protein